MALSFFGIEITLTVFLVLVGAGFLIAYAIWTLFKRWFAPWVASVCIAIVLGAAFSPLISLGLNQLTIYSEASELVKAVFSTGAGGLLAIILKSGTKKLLFERRRT